MKRSVRMFIFFSALYGTASFSLRLIASIENAGFQTCLNEEHNSTDADFKFRALNLPTTFAQSYTGQVLNLVTPVLGNIDYNRTIVNNFTITPATPFNILLRNGTTLTLGHHTVLGANQIINIEGKGNVINLPFNMTIGPKNLFLAPDAELTFQFSSGIIPTPELTISDGTIINIDRKTIIRLSGHGITTLGNGVLIDFKGAKTVNPITQMAIVSERGSWIVTDNATLRLAPNANARMLGVGYIEISRRGKIRFDAPGTLALGIDNPGVPVIVQNIDPLLPADNFNDIVFNVYDDGEVILQPGGAPGAPRAVLSFRYLASVINFENGGFLFMDDNGTFEINANGAVPNPSRLQALSFRAGLLEVRGSGIFAMGSNRINIGTGQPYPFSYSGIAAEIEGTPRNPGSAVYVAAAPVGFSGIVAPTTAAFDEINPQTALNVIRSFIGLSLI